MAIGSLVSHRHFCRAGLVTLAVAILILRANADDQLIKRDGSPINGQILGVEDNKVIVAGKYGKVPYPLIDIASATMTTPPEIATLKGAAPAAVISTLEPLVKKFAGLPTDWVVNAMGQLAEAYAATGKSGQALAEYNQIDTLYPDSKYHLEAVAGKAEMSFQQGKIDDAVAALQPLIDAANKNLAPSQAEGGMYAKAYLVYGQALEAQKKPAQALEAYLTVKTMFYQNPALAEQAGDLAKKLSDANPGLGVD